MATGDISRSSLYLEPFVEKATKIYSQVPTDGTGDFTFARNSTATYIDSAGILQTAAIDVPRLDYSRGTGCPELLIEPQSTNLALYSEDLSNGNWQKFNGAVSINSTTAPDNNVTADLFTPDNTANTHYIKISKIIAIPSGDISYKFYVKANGYSWIQISSGTGYFPNN
jgi:hypothetical protein